MTPMVRFSNHKTQSKKPLEPSAIVEPESYGMDDALTTSREEIEIGDEEEEVEESLLQRNDIPTKREEEPRQIADTIPATQVSKEKMLKIKLANIKKTNDPNNARKFELLTSLEEGKFIKIIGDVFASLSGDSVRCWAMVHYVGKQMNERKREHTLLNIGELAIEYFHLHPMDREKELKSVVFLCAWISHEKKYDVIVVGDGLDKALHIKDDVFGSGSGCHPGLRRLKSPGAPKDLQALVEEMMKASGRDPYTGGLIEVFLLGENGNCDSVYKGSLIQELYRHNRVYEDMFFNDRSMFVIICKDHAQILSPPDLKIYLRSFGWWIAGFAVI